MEIIETESIKKEKKYVFTKKELDELLAKNKEYGSRKTKEYIGFCIKNYKRQIDLFGAMELVIDIIDFIKDERDYIPNKLNMKFFEWLDKNR